MKVPIYLLIEYNGKRGLLYKSDQNKTFRCTKCGNRTSQRGKSLIRPTDYYWEEKDVPKRTVRNSNINVVGM